MLNHTRSDNIYGTLGTVVHDLLEGAQKGEIDDMEKAVETFTEEVAVAEFFGHSFPNGNRIDEDYVYANDLSSGQTQNFEIFTYIEDSKIDGMKAATFKIIEASAY